MIVADELQVLAPNLALWHAFDPKAKAELFSTAISFPQGTLVVDPIPLATPAQQDLEAMGPIAGIAVTNANHWRATAALSQEWNVPIFGHPNLQVAAAMPAFTPVRQDDKILDTCKVVAIDGATEGEIALYLPDSHGSIIVGDALINFEPYGFTFLPAKYCSNHKEMRQSLRQLLNYQSERMFFAHGMPILANATSRLEHLLHGG